MHKGKLKAIRVGTRRGVGERRYLREDTIKLITKYQLVYKLYGLTQEEIAII